MALTYTNNARLQMPGMADRNWDRPINANTMALDAMTAIGGLAVTPEEIPSTTLRVRVSAGNYVRGNGLVGQFGGVSAYPVPPSLSTCLWLNDSGMVQSGPSFPPTSHVRLASVTTDSNAVTSVADERVQCAAVGAGLGFVLRAGDSMTGSFSVVHPVSATPTFSVDASAMTIGFFGATPKSQAAAVSPLLDSSTGTVTNTIVGSGPTYSPTQLNANFASLTSKVNALIDALKRHGLMAG